MLSEFMSEWFADHSRWADAVIKVATTESAANQAKLSEWYVAWRDQVAEALRPLAAYVLGDAGDAAVDAAIDTLNARAAKLELTV